MSPQKSNRQQLLEGTLRCLERLPPEHITARVIADESNANLASIGYHFGSKDDLLTEAVILGLDQWLEEIESEMGDVGMTGAARRFQSATQVMERTRDRHLGLAKNFVSALARAQHDERVRALLADGFRRTRPNLAQLLDLGSDDTGDDAAGLVLALFYGLLLQVLVDPELSIDGRRMDAAQARLGAVLPKARSTRQRGAR
ncbi:MAG: TetR/AcrR family transcriptional regulator [Acidimicrobiia bacterium]